MVDDQASNPIDSLPKEPQIVHNRHRGYFIDNPEREQELITLWHDGWTGSRIAQAFGVTRSTIMGKIHRLRELGKMPPVVRKPPKAQARKKGKAPFLLGMRQRRRTSGVPKAIAAPTPIEGGVHIMDLKDHHCRAITGRGRDGLAVYCGVQKTDWAFRDRLIRSSYCADHNKVYHNSSIT